VNSYRLNHQLHSHFVMPVSFLSAFVPPPNLVLTILLSTRKIRIDHNFSLQTFTFYYIYRLFSRSSSLLHDQLRYCVPSYRLDIIHIKMRLTTSYVTCPPNDTCSSGALNTLWYRCILHSNNGVHYNALYIYYTFKNPIIRWPINSKLATGIGHEHWHWHWHQHWLRATPQQLAWPCNWYGHSIVYWAFCRLF